MASNLDDTFEEFYKEKFEGYIDLFVERCRTAVEESDQDFIEWLLKVVEHNKEMWCAIWEDKHFYENPEMIEMIYREVCKNELKIEGAKYWASRGARTTPRPKTVTGTQTTTPRMAVTARGKTRRRYRWRLSSLERRRPGTRQGWREQTPRTKDLWSSA